MRKNRTKLRTVVITLPAAHVCYFRIRTSKILSTFFFVARSLTLDHLLHGPDFDVPFFQTIRWPDLVGGAIHDFYSEVPRKRSRNN